MTGRHFRDYHPLLDEQAEQIFAITDEIAERVRKIGGQTLRSIGDISRRQRLVITTKRVSLQKLCSLNYGTTTRT